MRNPKISIIVPVYNTSKYLDKCINSLLNQVYKNYEIIIINDGSTDNSLDIIKKYKDLNSNITILEQSNSGQSVARNNAIKIAQGEYITFVDSDDWVSTNYLSDMCSCLDYDVDILVSNISLVYDNQKEIKLLEFPFSKLSNMEAVNEILIDQVLKSYPVGKLFKKDLFFNNQVFFPEGMLYEDLAILIKLFYYSKNVILINSYNYYYRQSVDSSTRKPNRKLIYDKIKALNLIKEFLLAKGIYNQFYQSYTSLCLFHLYIMRNQLSRWNFNDIDEYVVKNILILIEKSKISKDIIWKSDLDIDKKIYLYFYDKSKIILKLFQLIMKIKNRLITFKNSR